MSFFSVGERFTPIESAEKSLQTLVADLGQVRQGGEVRIFCGSANPEIYDTDEFEGIIRKITAPLISAKVRMLTGLVVLSKYEDTLPRLFRLRDVPGFNMKHRIVRGVDAHFRTVETDNEAGYVYHQEYPHAELAPLDKLWILDTSNLTPGQIRGKAGILQDVFAAWYGRDDMSTSTAFVTTVEKYKQLIELSKVLPKDIPFDYLQLPDLVSIQARYLPASSLRLLT